MIHFSVLLGWFGGGGAFGFQNVASYSAPFSSASVHAPCTISCNEVVSDDEVVQTQRFPSQKPATVSLRAWKITCCSLEVCTFCAFIYLFFASYTFPKSCCAKRWPKVSVFLLSANKTPQNTQNLISLWGKTMKERTFWCLLGKCVFLSFVSSCPSGFHVCPCLWR